MKDFFDMLSDFLSSDFAKENASVIAVFAIALVVISVFLTIFIFNKFVIPLRLNKSENIMKDYEKVLEENDRLKSEMINLKNTKKMLDAANSESSDSEELEGWEKEFLKKKKKR